MKKIVLTLTAVLIFGWQGISFADSAVDSLIQKLKDKGILTDQDAAQLKGQIASEQQTSQAAQATTFKSMLPDWVSGLKIGGDFRLRDQVNYRKIPGGTTVSGDKDLRQNRGRLRARLNFEDQINDKVKVVVGIATSGGTARSNNYTFGGAKANGDGVTNQDSFGKPEIILNKAYAVYTPNNMITLMGGKMDNPIWEPAGASFFWDPDITPEGGSIQVQKKINDYITPWAQADALVIHDLAPTTSTKTDPFMFVAQAGIKGNATEKIYYKAGASWYDISNPSHLVFGEDLGSNSLSTATTYMYSFNDVLVGGLDVGMNDPFGELLPSPIYIPQIGVFGDFAYNASPTNPDVGSNTQNKAWEMGAYMGNTALNGWGTWKIQSYYKVLERDSWLDVFPDDDFYSGYTNTKGWRTQLDIGLMKNVWFTFSYYHTNIFKDVSTLSIGGLSSTPAAFSKSAPENLFQMDLNFKF